VSPDVSPNATRTGLTRTNLAVAAGFVLLTILFTWPLPARIFTHVNGTGTDPELLMWAMGWNAHAFVHQPLAIFDANIFYPSRYALAYSENMLGSTVLLAPVLWTTGDLVLSMNLVQLSSIALSAIGAYLLARSLGLGVLPAIVAGVIFGFAPARFFRMAQAHLTTIQWIPFCLASLHTYFSPAGRARHLKLAALFFSLQALASGHGVVFLAVAAVALVSWQLSTGTPLQPVRRVRDLGVMGTLALLPAGALLLPYRAARGEVPSLHRGLGDYGSTLSSYVSSPAPFHQWMLEFLPAWITAERPDAYLFPGILPLLLAGAAMVGWLARSIRTEHQTGAPAGWRHPVALYGLLALVAFWFTIGPPYGLWQFTHSLPVFSFLRVPSRFVLLEVLALGIVAAFGARWVATRIAPARQTTVLAATTLLLVVEFFPWGIDTTPFKVETTSADRWLASQTGPLVVAEFPVPDSLAETTQALRATRFMLHSTAHWHKIVHGYSGAEPAHYRPLREHMKNFPSTASVEALAAHGVTHVVVHPFIYEEDQSDFAAVERWITDNPEWLRVEYVSRDGRVYSLHRPGE
jgi:hypothetical protein